MRPHLKLKKVASEPPKHIKAIPKSVRISNDNSRKGKRGNSAADIDEAKEASRRLVKAKTKSNMTGRQRVKSNDYDEGGPARRSISVEGMVKESQFLFRDSSVNNSSLQR